METQTTEEKVKLIEELKGAHHSFLSKEGCEHYLLPFGVIPRLEKVKANPQDFKGLSLWDKKGNAIDEAEGLSGLDVSSLIVDKLGLEVRGHLGRGFQHRANCEAIIEELKG